MRRHRLLRLLGLVTLLALLLGRGAWAREPRQTGALQQPSFLLSRLRFAPLPEQPKAISWSLLAPAWHLETVDSAGWVGEFNSLALDSQDHPHINYWDRDLWVLKYAHNDGSGWITETVDSAGYIGWYPTSLAVDAVDRPHISYCASPYYSECTELRYAWYDGSAWITETVDSGVYGGYASSLALDAADRPHISYSSTGLRYAYYDGTAWVSETVDWDGHGISGISLALDSSGKPHVSYIKGLGSLVYAHFDGTQWVYEDVGGVGEGGSFTSLALDLAGLPHIAYNAGDWTGMWLGYMYHDGQAWHDETVDGESMNYQYVGNDGALALDGAGHAHIGYTYSQGPYNYLRYAHHDGAAWWIETVAGAGDCVSLALDSAGRAHIGYCTAGGLRHASRLCMPVLGANIDGPIRLPVGVTGHYSATAGPLDAATPITLTWADGTVSATAAYSWTAVSTTTLAVTATNPCGEVRGALTVTVCQPLTGVTVTGPPVLFAGQPGVYQASPQPFTATPPLTYTWSNGTVGITSTYRWPVTGTHTLTVTTTNDCDSVVTATLSVQVVQWPYQVYLPLLLRE